MVRSYKLRHPSMAVNTTREYARIQGGGELLSLGSTEGESRVAVGSMSEPGGCDLDETISERQNPLEVTGSG